MLRTLAHSLPRRIYPRSLPVPALFLTRTMSNAAAAAAAPPPADLEAQIVSLGNRIRQLKIDKQPIETELAELNKLKALAPKKEKPAGAAGPSAAGGKKGDKKPAASSRLILKVPKGTKDFLPQETTVRKRIFSTLESIFLAHGASTIDTPVFELKEILAGKYGEDSKLIYDLQDQGGELCSLRYDLTVPFARFLAMNGLTSLKRYHIAKVYRRDQPAMSKGRLREFYQCDFDIAGTYDSMVPDAEILTILCEALTKLDIGDFTVKINHRKILDGIFSICGVPEDKIRAISSAVDKLDKAPWSDVKKEMVEEKGLDAGVADKIGDYVKLKGQGFELLSKLEQDATLTGNQEASEGLKDMKILFEYLEIYGCLDKMSFDLSLARGLDYYTGIIYEAVTEYSAPPAPTLTAASTPAAPKVEGGDVDESTVGVGSIAAGGRYDNLVGMFASAASGAEGKKKQKALEQGRVPCVGISVGVERVYAIMMARQAERERTTGKAARGKETKVYVVSVGDGLIKERMQICKELWEAGVAAEFMYKNKPKNIKLQFDVIDKESIPFAVIIGADEIASGNVRIKDQTRTKEELAQAEAVGAVEGASSPNGELVKREEMIEWIRKRLEVVGDRW